MLSYVGNKNLFWAKTVKFCQNHKKRKYLYYPYFVNLFPLQSYRTKSRDNVTVKRYIYIMAVSGHLNLSGVK